jgi:mono/diheme cytochrome c family protein
MISGCSDAGETAANRENKPLSGETVYRKYCVSCHGAIGQRIVAGRQLRETSLEPQHIMAIISHGILPMPSFEKYLNEQEIKNVTEYVIGLKIEKKN